MPRRQLRPGDSVRRVAFQCDVLLMVLDERHLGFPLILPNYLMAVNFTAFAHSAQYVQTLFSIAPCSMHGCDELNCGTTQDVNEDTQILVQSLTAKTKTDKI